MIMLDGCFDVMW